MSRSCNNSGNALFATPYPTVNPSYVTNEVTFGSCPYVSATSGSTSDWTQNVPRIPGDSVLGIYGDDYLQFLKPTTCLKCGICQDNSVTDLYYKPQRSYEFPTYGFVYRGKDHYFRKPY